MSSLTPGVYKATVRGVPDVIVLVDDRGYGHHDSSGSSRHSDSHQITDARPLIVLDLGEHKAEDLTVAMRAMSESAFLTSYQGALIHFAASEIEAQAMPPRIPEPGQGARVDAKSDEAPSTAGRTEFMRIRGRGLNWVNLDDGNVCEWGDLIDPTLIREGIEDPR